jgi:hypothetical protein
VAGPSNLVKRNQAGISKAGRYLGIAQSAGKNMNFSWLLADTALGPAHAQPSGFEALF